MTEEVPRRLPLTPEERLKIVVGTVATGSAEGATAFAKNVVSFGNNVSLASTSAVVVDPVITVPPPTAVDPIVEGTQRTADGKNTVYNQPLEPTGGTYKSGDIWFDTDDGYKMYVYVPGHTPSPWVYQLDASIPTDQDVQDLVQIGLDGKSRTFVGSSTPVYTAPAVAAIGDVWIDTGNGNAIKTWSGSAWVIKQFGSTAISDNAITTAKILAGQIITSKLAAGAITANEIAANAVTATKIAAGTITANHIIASGLTAAVITTGTLTGITITGVNINGTTITGTTYRNLPVGTSPVSGNQNGVEILSAGIRIDMTNVSGGSIPFSVWQNSGSSSSIAAFYYGSSGRSLVHGGGGFHVTNINGTTQSSSRPQNGNYLLNPDAYYRIQPSGSLTCLIAASGAFCVGSSMRALKMEIKDVDSDLDPDRLLSLPVRQFKWNPDSFDVPVSEAPMVGFIVDEVAEHYPVALAGAEGNPTDWDARIMLPAMLELIQRQAKRIERLEAGHGA